MSERLELLRGSDLGPHLDALAALRIRVFRDWPYLYEGTADYETSLPRNLSAFAEQPDCSGLGRRGLRRRFHRAAAGRGQ